MKIGPVDLAKSRPSARTGKFSNGFLKVRVHNRFCVWVVLVKDWKGKKQREDGCHRAKSTGSREESESKG